MLVVFLASMVLAAPGAGPGAPSEAMALPGTALLTLQGDLAAQMVAGIDAFLMKGLEASIERRQRYWRRDFASYEAYVVSVDPNRERFKTIIGG